MNIFQDLILFILRKFAFVHMREDTEQLKGRKDVLNRIQQVKNDIKSLIAARPVQTFNFNEKCLLKHYKKELQEYEKYFEHLSKIDFHCF